MTAFHKRYQDRPDYQVDGRLLLFGRDLSPDVAGKQIDKPGQSCFCELSAADETARTRPFSKLFFCTAEQTGQQAVEVLVHHAKMTGSLGGFLHPHVFLALPAHGMKQQGEVRRHETSLAGGKGEQRR